MAGQVEPGQSVAAVIEVQRRPTLAPPAHTWKRPQPPEPPTPMSELQNVVRAVQTPPPAQSAFTLHGAPAFVPSSHHPVLLQTAGLAQPKAFTFVPPAWFDVTS